jgi:hypothetical protein
LLPITLSLAVSDGWLQPSLVIGLFLFLELVSNNLMEPWLYGHSIGVSTVALVTAAAFWTFLWGPIGLVLSAPLTVCLAVLGKYVPQLEFFDVLLNDGPPLEPPVTLYQRLLARDQDEAAQIVQTYLKSHSHENVYDELLVPALVAAKRDRERDQITDQDEEFILQAMREIIEDLGEHQASMLPAEKVDASGNGRGQDKSENPDTDRAIPPKVMVLTCPARDEADRLALEMLRQLLDPIRWQVEIAPVETLAAELLAMVETKMPAVICIGSLPPGGLAHTRYLCKRLSTRFPDLRIVVGRWGRRGDRENQTELGSAGATKVDETLLETRAQLASFHPIVAPQRNIARVAAITIADGVND